MAVGDCCGIKQQQAGTGAKAAETGRHGIVYSERCGGRVAFNHMPFMESSMHLHEPYGTTVMLYTKLRYCPDGLYLSQY